MAGIVAARVELANEALFLLAQMLYERDADGVFANVDTRTYRLLVPAPWGRAGYKKWNGIRAQEATILRGVLLARQRSGVKPPRPALYLYDEESRCWRLNLDDYGTFEAAQWWLKRSPVVSAEWREVADRVARKVSGR